MEYFHELPKFFTHLRISSYFFTVIPDLFYTCERLFF